MALRSRRERRSPARLRSATLAALLAVLALVAGAVRAPAPVHGSPTAPPAAGQRAPDDRTDRTAPGPDPSIRLIQQTPLIRPNDGFAIFLEVTGAPAGSDLAVDIYPLIDSEERLEDALEGEPHNSSATFPVIDLPGDPSVAPVQTGFVINVSGPGDALQPGGWSTRLSEPGVYPIGIRLRGPDNATVGSVVTFLVRGPGADDVIEPTPVALVPRFTSGTDPADDLAGPVPTIDPERLDAMTTLAETFVAHPEVPASFWVAADVARALAAAAPPPPPPAGEDPDRGGPGSAANGGTTSSDPTTTTTTTSTTTTSAVDGAPSSGGPRHDAAGAAALAALRAALEPAGRQLLTSPYVDVDPAALVTAGLGAELTRQFNLGFRDLADALQPPVVDTWLVDRRLDPAAVDALASLGVTTLLVPPAAIDGEVPALPARLRGATDDVRAVTIDHDLGDTSDPALAAHRLVAHLIARATIDDGAPQVVAISLPDRVEDVTALDDTLGLLAGGHPFLQVSTVSDLAESSASADRRATLAPPDLPDMGSFPGELTATRRSLEAYASMVEGRDDLVARFSEPLARSAAVGLTPGERVSAVHRVRDAVEQRFASVAIPPTDRVTLGARDASFPLVISSTSDEPLRVVVELTSASDRLTVVEPRIEVLLDSDRTVVPVHVRSRSPGDTPVRIDVTTPDGQVLLSEGSYSVRSTAVSGMGLVLTVGAGLFLAAWWGRHLVRARRTKAARHAR